MERNRTFPSVDTLMAATVSTLKTLELSANVRKNKREGEGVGVVNWAWGRGEGMYMCSVCV